MRNFADRLAEKIAELNNPTVMGLDPLIGYLPAFLIEKHGLPGYDAESTAINDSEIFFSCASGAILEFNKMLIDAVRGLIPAVKPQIAYYEILGAEGIKAYRNTIDYAKAQGMLVIADAKRNDIGSTAAMYSAAFLGKTDSGSGIEHAAFDADALTVNAYTGIDGIRPFIDDCSKYGKGIFILVRTSNPSASDFQDLKLESGRSFYEIVAENVAEWGKDLTGDSGYSSVGAVVGATWPEQAKLLRKIMPENFILVPGYGAQGGTGETVSGCFDGKGKGAIVNASRSIMLAYRNNGSSGEDIQSAAYNEAVRMRDDLNNHIFA